MKLRPELIVDPYDDALARLSAVNDNEVLLPYQRLAIHEASLFALLVIEKSRRIGLTWGIAALAVMTAASSRAAGGMKVWYMGYDMEMAREFIDTCGMWAKAFGHAVSDPSEITLRDPDGDIKAFRVTFASGFEIVALPSVARALRGKQGLVILDEAAFMSDLEEVLKAALALMIWGGRVVVISTHDGVDNPFNIMIDDIKAGKRKGGTLRITFDDAIADGLYERVALMSPKALPAKAEWIKDIRDTYGENQSEELDCLPKTGGGSWINPGDYASCEHDDAGKPELYQGGPVYIGRDVARRGDKAVVWAFEEVGDILWLRERYEEVGATFAEQDEAMDRMIKRYRTMKAKVDQTGMGEKVVEDAQLRWGSMVEGVLFTGPNRLDLATGYRLRFETCTIRLPKDPKIRADHRSLKRASRTNKALAEGEVHPDMFWAGALAESAARDGVHIYEYEPASSLNPDNDDDDGFGGRHGGHLDQGMTHHGMARGGGAW
jgi:phage FluMu gp28-like protein